MKPILVLRPEPGASQTARRVRDLGLEPVVAPLFEIRAVAWEAVDSRDFDAVLITSANAARLGGVQLEALAHLPCFTAGEASAEAAEAAGFATVVAGTADGAAALALAEGRILHLCGREHVALPGVTRRIVYAADPLPLGAQAQAALAEGAVTLLHSPRAGARLAELVAVRGHIPLAAISAAAADAAGEGWASKAVAARPRDEALLEVAAKLCNNRPSDAAGTGL